MKSRRQPTPEQKAAAEARRAKFRTLVKTVAAMPDHERQAILDRVGAVITCEGRALSPTNTMLCLMQLPNVSMVGGFQQWLRQGRSVMKGQHGISIWIPCAGKKAEDGEEEGETYFTMGTVFDVSQTAELACAPCGQSPCACNDYSDTAGPNYIRAAEIQAEEEKAA